METSSSAKSTRLLEIYARLVSGEVLEKDLLAEEYHVSDRSIQRDMNSLRCFLSDQGLPQELTYDYQDQGYKLVDCCVPANNRRVVNTLLSNEKFHYIEPHHGKPILDMLWELGQAVQTQEVIEIAYQKIGSEEPVQRTIEPVGVLFSEFYFYVVGFIQNINKQESFENPDDLFPTIYRVDRIQFLHRTGEHFPVPYASRFEEGEFRKRVQFMYGGKLQRIRFRYTGPSIEAVLDRLPTAEVRERTEDGWIVEAEVFGKGVEMWMRSQGEYIQMEETTDE